MDINNTFEEISACLEDDSKVNYNEEFILKNLLLGKTRDELALELNHKNYRTIDMYMRRRGYIWDSDKQIYVKKSENFSKDDFNPATSKCEKIISMFSSGMEPMEVAKKMGMKDHKVMANYMSSKGYVWNSDKQNYVFQKGIKSTTEKEEDSETYLNFNEITNLCSSESNIDNKNSEISEDSFKTLFEKLQNLYPMLEMINKNKDKLVQILAINKNTIPRYAVGGITITKSLCMSHTLAELVKDFSAEKNISQREIFEVSIIEFLQKYGYESEVKSLFR